MNLGIEWNADNQLIEVQENETTVATFEYDPLGRRVEKVAGGSTTTFTYDGEDTLREIAGATTTYYVHGPGIDEPLAKEVSGSLTYYHADALGSVLKMTNASGTVTQEYRYDAYGRIEAGSTQGGYSFTGREWDPEISAYYYRARYYDPNQGRFLNEDPIGLAGGWNLFQYANANPANFVDPDGLFVMKTPPGFEMGLLDKILFPTEFIAPLGVAKYGAKAAERTIRNTAKQIRKHEEKLRDYMEDPFKYDNKDFLKNAPDPSKVVKERINKLIQQIETFCKNIEEAWKKLDPPPGEK